VEREPGDVLAVGDTEPVDTIEVNSGPDPPKTPADPASIGRYRVLGLLGEGGFGRVYLAHDEALGRPVAVKVYRAERVARFTDPESYLEEARILASLDHPNIVPVFDAGQTADGLCYVVSKVIDGADLKTAFKAGCAGSTRREIAALIAAIADALQHAHQRGLVHRDVKPGNILVDRAGKAFLADFGLALREEDFGTGPEYAGTPAYMSPEQARGEGHRVDGRTDIFSLGVVFYELLVGRHPFGSGDRAVMLERIATGEVRPPRQIDDSIARELERICLRSLARRISERYNTANDFAEDLRQYLATPRSELSAERAPTKTPIDEPAPAPPAHASHSTMPRVVPRGLRSFEADDAEFFLDLLPGPRDRHGLSESIRFWKARIEQTDPEATFPVGLLYGPSGCGKSSFVKAGLLPRLAPQVRTVYLDADDDLERRLLHRLRKLGSTVDPRLDLAATLAAFRRGALFPQDAKVLIVIDQFEQWLHANREGMGTELVNALRQCDGGRVQALMMVRDDFWAMASRFMRELEVRVVEGHNAAMVDLFTPRHARTILAAFGGAYGVIPERFDQLSASENAFLDEAVVALTEDGKVMPVRLALFAEIVKDRRWTADALKRLGGTVGVAVTFLDEQFSAATAPPERRHHLAAVRAVLGALLPAPGANIKGQKRSRDELMAVTGYARAPDEFDALLRILDRETRLLTPIAPEPDARPGAVAAAQPAQEYQLAHDFLVPPIREWLDRARRETPRGRAEITLAERAAFWSAKPERKQLPSFVEWLAIWRHTRPAAWLPSERAMMKQASRHQLRRIAGVVAVAGAIAAAIPLVREQLAERSRATRAEHLVQRILDANITTVPGLVAEIGAYRRWADPLLAQAIARTETGTDHARRARLALLPVDSSQIRPLTDWLLEANPDEFRVLRASLRLHREPLLAPLWRELDASDGESSRRIRAAAALAAYDPAGPGWDRQAQFVADWLVSQPTFITTQWLDLLRPVDARLVPPLRRLFSDTTKQTAATRHNAAEILAEYLRDRPQSLAGLLVDAEPAEFLTLYARLEAQPGAARAALEKLQGDPVRPAGPLPPERIVMREANIGIALFKLGATDELWPLLKAGPDPRVRAYVIDRMAPAACDPEALAARARTERDPSIRAAIYLALTNFPTELARTRLERTMLRSLRDAYCDDPDPGVHGAAGALLRRWGRTDLLREARSEPPGERNLTARGWRVTPLGHTMVRIPGPATLTIAPDHPETPPLKITQSFEIGATEVSVAQFAPFLASDPNRARRFSGPDHPDGEKPRDFVSWYTAAEFCNWLSKEEGLPSCQWCYLPNEQGEYRSGMKIAPDAINLAGYRLPTASEWEYACRAGAITSRSFGESDSLLTRYACCVLNPFNPPNDEPWPVASLLPNNLGLFDMHGNLFEWCLDRAGARPDSAGQGPEESVSDSANRALRGAGFLTPPRHIRFGRNYSDAPGYNTVVNGFRLARTPTVVYPGGR
jgi:serine/threonine protein kinase/formylglycine-generating enzyme required for sulfatase activity